MKLIPTFPEWIIHCNNAGANTDFNVVVQNNITEMLALPTIDLTASSYPVNMAYKPHSRLFSFPFDNILLRDFIVNEPISHGFPVIALNLNLHLLLVIVL